MPKVNLSLKEKIQSLESYMIGNKRKRDNEWFRSLRNPNNLVLIINNLLISIIKTIKDLENNIIFRIFAY